MKKRLFTSEFRSRAVAMVVKEGIRSSEVSKNLGIGHSTLQKWVRASQGVASSNSDSNEENRLLRAKLKQTEMERDILKKAMAFFAKG